MPSQQDVINTILAEAGNSQQGMAAVAHVIANRAAQRGLTPAQVVAQPHQFEAFSNPSPGGIANQQNPALRAQAEQIWQGVQDGTVPDPTAGGTNYFANYIAPPDWARGAVATGQTANIGGQTFLLGSGTMPPMNIPAVASATANTDAPTPMPLRSDAAQQAVTNLDGSTNWGAFYQGLTPATPLAAGPTGSPVNGDFAALAMQSQDPGLSSALANYAAQAQGGTPLSLADRLVFNPINVPNSTLAMGDPNANYGDALTNNAPTASYPPGATAGSGATLSNFLASIGATSAVGQPPVTRPVTSVAISANGQPVTSAPGGIDSVPNPGAGYNSLYGQGNSTGNVFTGQGIAGTVQLPRSASPGAAAEAQAVAAMNGGGAPPSNSASWAALQSSFGAQPSIAASNGGGGNSGGDNASQSWASLINSFDGPTNYADGSVNNFKDQSQLPQGTGLSFAGPSSAPVTTTTAPTTRQVVTQQLNPAYQAWLNNQNSAIYGVQGVESPSLDANGNVALPSSYLGAAPAKYIPITKTITVPGHTVSAAPSLGIAAAPTQQPIAATNGYLYQPNGTGGYTNVGSAPGAPSYDQIAARILATNVNTGSYQSASGAVFQGASMNGGGSGGQDRAGGGLTG